MAGLTLKDIKKIYPHSGEQKKKKKVKKGEQVEEKKVNLQVTEEGVVAVQAFNLDIKDKEFIVLVGPSGSWLFKTYSVEIRAFKRQGCIRLRSLCT